MCPEVFWSECLGGGRLFCVLTSLSCQEVEPTQREAYWEKMCQQFLLNSFHFNVLWVTQTFLVRWRFQITWWKTGWVRSLTLPFVLLTWAIWFYTEWFGVILHEEVGEIPLLLPLTATIINRRKQIGKIIRFYSTCCGQMCQGLWSTQTKINLWGGSIQCSQIKLRGGTSLWNKYLVLVWCSRELQAVDRRSR